VLPTRLRQSLYAIYLVGAATLFRSVHYGRWVTVLAALVLIAGAAAVQRGRTWGIGLSLGAATTFTMVWLLGMAPAWFCLVGFVGALPFFLIARSLARVDAGATALGAGLVIAAGSVGALSWRGLSHHIMTLSHAFRPPWEPSSVGMGMILLGLAGGVGLFFKRHSALPLVPSLAASPVRVALPTTRYEATDRRVDDTDMVPLDTVEAPVTRARRA
jgi:hypothetical protein